MASDSPPLDQMATLLMQPGQPLSATPQSAGINKRYRPAPAKTFQCRGYGDCRMVFSRSEHLARHIRKHTGERPFTCHCGKQFSRLDNLRQHAQTVHADKQEQNERMMRDLTSLHASMAAANKVNQTRGKRGQVPTSVSSNLVDDGIDHQGVKQEDLQATIPMHQRPGTSTGYEGSGPDSNNGLVYHPNASARTWHVQTANVDRPNSRPVNSHSFRDPSQSFRAPSAASSIAASANASSHASAPQHGQPAQSFLASRDAFDLGLASDGNPRPRADVRPGSSASRPTTASLEPADAHPRSLPPLAAVVSSSFPASQWGVPAQPLLSFPPGPGVGGGPGRPSTATRPGTAPAAYYSASAAFGGGGPGMGARPDLSLSAFYGRSLGATELAPLLPPPGPAPGDAGDGPASPLGYDSPFSFHPPALAEPGPASASSSAAASVPRKRPHPGSDDDHDRGPAPPAPEPESRPQSRRLSVMELCNGDAAADAAARPLLPLSAAAGARAAAAAGSRPGTSSGLVASAAQLALADPPQPLRAGAAPPAAGAAAPAARAARAPRGAAGGVPGGGVPRAHGELSTAAAAAAAPVFRAVGDERMHYAAAAAAAGYAQAYAEEPARYSVSPPNAHSPLGMRV